MSKENLVNGRFTKLRVWFRPNEIFGTKSELPEKLEDGKCFFFNYQSSVRTAFFTGLDPFLVWSLINFDAKTHFLLLVFV